jgi:predicted metalloendopeptidase
MALFDPNIGSMSELLRATEAMAMAVHQENLIFITTAIFQIPFFDPEQPGAVNYGAMGVVVGHELTHHFGRSQFECLKSA